MNNEEYWRQRFKQLETLTYNKSQEYYKRIIKAFNITETKIKQIINEFYSRFASLEDISISEAKKVLEADELEAFHMSVEQYIQYGIENNKHWNPDIDKLMEEASIKYRVTRLEAAFYQFAGEIGMLTDQEIGELYSLLGDVYIDRYYRTAFEVFQNYGVGTSFEMIDMNRLEMILDQPWAVDGTNFSSRLWSQQTKLVNQLAQTLTQACVRGEGYTETIDYLARAMNTSKSNAGRLVVTESAYFASRAQNSCFEELGAEQYEIIATLDNITDPECQDLDGRVYDMSEFQVGVTAPPFHPNCRCTTAPYFDDSDIPGYIEGTRTARDPGGKTYRVPKNMKYSEWREKYNINPKYGASENTPEPEENSSIVLESPNNQSKIGSNNTVMNTRRFDREAFNSRIKNGKAINPMDKDTFENIKKGLERQGVTVLHGANDPDLQKYLTLLGAEGTYSQNFISIMGDIPSRSTIFEEIIHWQQAVKYGELLEPDWVETARREVAANRRLLEKNYLLDEMDIEDTKRNLDYWENYLIKLTGESYDESGIFRDL